ncbi:MAG TPA: hypothetical protein VMS78_00230 [Rhizomicrobium sp.]|nr:hypothetical protein [Rhizomicrobium sp.]
MRRALVFFAFTLACIGQANAGAWTQDEDSGQTISTFTYSRASRSYDASASPTIPIRYLKLLTQTYIEYGVRDWLTLTADPEYAKAESGPPGGPIEVANAFAIGAGARLRLMNDRRGVFSLQGSYKSAGAFDTSVSVNQESARQFEIRALYGIDFPVFDMTGFADLEAGERFVAGARPNETPIDITVGLHITPGTMILGQSFNVISGGDAEPPYGYYRSHKLQLSIVQHVLDTTSVQIGAFVSPAGQSALKEYGLTFAIWDSF